MSVLKSVFVTILGVIMLYYPRDPVESSLKEMYLSDIREILKRGDNPNTLLVTRNTLLMTAPKSSESSTSFNFNSYNTIIGHFVLHTFFVKQLL